MKKVVLIGIFLSLALGGSFVAFNKFAYAQKASKADDLGTIVQDNRGIEEGYNNDPYDVHGCVWRSDFNDDGTIDYHKEEPQAPPEFYINSPPIDADSVCDFFSANDWVELKKRGEVALWPPGCFNPVNVFWFLPVGSFEMNKNYDSWDEFYYVAMGAYNKRQDPANIDLKLQTQSPAQGQDISIIAAPFRYKSPAEKLLYGWASQLQGQKYVSQQGLVAGGRELTESDVKDFSFPEGDIGNLDTCRRITRNIANPQINDRDNDGMDDNWERRYAPNGDIAGFTPEGDPDQDGVSFDDASFLNQENKPRKDEEGNPIPTADVYDGIRVTPDTTAKSAPGDGKFTNIEEFIWGTNPVDPDTDDDGYPDEADIVGLGQSTFKQAAEIGQSQGVPDRITYRATTVGISNLVDEKNTGHQKILIDSDAKTVIAGIESDLRASVYNVNQTPNATLVTGSSSLNDGKDIFVEADAFQSQGDKAVLDYSWYVEFRNAGSTRVSDRVQVPPTPEFTTQDMQSNIGRVGRYTFRHPLTELLKYVPSNYDFDNKSGSLIYVTAEISNLVTHEFASKRIPISIGSDQSMGLQITDLNNGKTMAAEDYVSQYCHDLDNKNLVHPSFCLLAGTTLNQILPWIIFAGSRVEVIAQPIQADANNLVYEWYVNEEKVNEAYGADSNDNKLVLYPDSTTKTYDVVVKGFTKDQYRNEVFNGQISMAVEGPQVGIVSRPRAHQGTLWLL
jgi:hypothetical protein